MARVPPAYVPLHVLAQRVGLPEAWLRREARAGRIPALKIGRRLFFNRAAVEGVLLERAAQESVGSPGEAGATAPIATEARA